MKNFNAINLVASVEFGIQKFEIEDYPEAEFISSADYFLKDCKTLQHGELIFYQVLPDGTDGEYERIDAEYGITE